MARKPFSELGEGEEERVIREKLIWEELALLEVRDGTGHEYQRLQLAQTHLSNNAKLMADFTAYNG